MTNKLYYGDNLHVLRESIDDESVDLVYLDPPFNSNANYNVLFKSKSGEQSHAQVEAFQDTWHWTEEAENAFDEVMKGSNTDVAEMLRSMRMFLRENDMMAYLTMMTIRLIELHRVLKETGSIYLHCDPTASHYLKIIMDAVFGKSNYRNEIIWKRGAPKNNAKQGSKHFGRTTDTILFYTKSDDYSFNHQYEKYSDDDIRKKFKYEDERGSFCLHPLDGPGGEAKGNPVYELLGVTRAWRYSKENMSKLLAEGKIYQAKSGNVPMKKFYLDEANGIELQNVWTDLTNLRGNSAEFLCYPTQKPLALLERIVEASSNEGDIILDPFCGCGTAVHAAQKLKRKWVGIDITTIAISLIEKRLKDAFPKIKFIIQGTPKDMDGAKLLCDTDKHEFQTWAVSLVGAIPFGGGKKGADGGIDGYIYFKPDGKTTEKAIVSVKGGANVGVAMIRDLGHVIDREKAKVGVFITFTTPTEPMLKEAIKSGYYETGFGKYPKIQIFTIQDLFEGKKPNIPLVDPSAFRRAKMELNEKQEEWDL